MRTELSGGTSVTERRTMDDESREPANGFLPAGVAQVPKEELQRYLKCKRIGNYLLGKTVGEGSFARVKQGFHVLTGEKVGNRNYDISDVIIRFGSRVNCKVPVLGISFCRSVCRNNSKVIA